MRLNEISKKEFIKTLEDPWRVRIDKIVNLTVSKMKSLMLDNPRLNHDASIIDYHFVPAADSFQIVVFLLWKENRRQAYMIDFKSDFDEIYHKTFQSVADRDVKLHSGFDKMATNRGQLDFHYQIERMPTN